MRIRFEPSIRSSSPSQLRFSREFIKRKKNCLRHYFPLPQKIIDIEKNTVRTIARIRAIARLQRPQSEVSRRLTRDRRTLTEREDVVENGCCVRERVRNSTIVSTRRRSERDLALASRADRPESQRNAAKCRLMSDLPRRRSRPGKCSATRARMMRHAGTILL